jgi:Bacterial Ig-like domain (group 3)
MSRTRSTTAAAATLLAFLMLPAAAGAATPTTTTVTCTPSPATVGQTASCTARVDPSPAPEGTVAFTATGGGTLTAGSCVLNALTGTSQCKVGYIPAQVGSHQITAAYQGDLEHDPSQGSVALEAVQPAKAKTRCKKGFTLKKVKTKSGKIKKKCVKKKKRR